MKYIPSVAYSLCDHDEDADFEPLRPYVKQITEWVLREGLAPGVCLNVNFPDPSNLPCLGEALDSPPEQGELEGVFRGVKVCRMSRGTWGSEVSRCHHPRGYDYWWMVGHYRNDEPEATDTDRWALDNGYVAVTPTEIDVTAYEAMEELRELEKI